MFSRYMLSAEELDDEFETLDARLLELNKVYGKFHYFKLG